MLFAVWKFSEPRPSHSDNLLLLLQFNPPAPSATSPAARAPASACCPVPPAASGNRRLDERLCASSPWIIFNRWSKTNLTHLCQRLDSGHAVPHHKVGQHSGGAPRHPHLAVDQHLAWEDGGLGEEGLLTAALQPLLNELHHLVKVEGNVGLWHVKQLQPLVLDPKWPGQLYKWASFTPTCRTSHWCPRCRSAAPPQCSVRASHQPSSDRRCSWQHPWNKRWTHGLETHWFPM